MNAKVRKAAREAIKALDDDTLSLLIDLSDLLGTCREWPEWAHDALEGRQPSRETRTEFQRLLDRAWMQAGWQTRMALERIARGLNVPVPADEQPASSAMRRTQPPQCTARGETPPSSPSTPHRKNKARRASQAGSKAANEGEGDLTSDVRQRDDSRAWEPSWSFLDALWWR